MYCMYEVKACVVCIKPVHVFQVSYTLVLTCILQGTQTPQHKVETSVYLTLVE
jgi:hypothetical protein